MANGNIVIVGAGLAGAVLARRIAEETDYNCTVFDQREHVAGNCYTERDTRTNIMVHKYGPHIFHTNFKEVWDFVNRFAEFGQYLHVVIANSPKGIYSLPINLLTINQFFKKSFNPSEAKQFIEELQDKSIKNPKNFEEQALRFIGRELYDAFFYGYTKKQWGVEPLEISASVIERLPIRFTYDVVYFLNSKFQGIPLEGYTRMVQNIFDHPRIEVKLNEKVDTHIKDDCKYLFWSGTLDEFFNFRFGRLGYRTVYWDELYQKDVFQGISQMNYTDYSIPFTRIIEPKFFTPWEDHKETIFMIEYSKQTEANDIPYYPLRLQKDKEILAKYKTLARTIGNVSFLGRLGTYKYLDMDKVIYETLKFSEMVIKVLQNKSGEIPTFSDDHYLLDEMPPS